MPAESTSTVEGTSVFSWSKRSSRSKTIGYGAGGVRETSGRLRAVVGERDPDDLAAPAPDALPELLEMRSLRITDHSRGVEERDPDRLPAERKSGFPSRVERAGRARGWSDPGSPRGGPARGHGLRTSRAESHEQERGDCRRHRRRATDSARAKLRMRSKRRKEGAGARRRGTAAWRRKEAPC